MLPPYEEMRKIDVSPYCKTREAVDENRRKIQVPYLNWAKCKDLLHQYGAKTVYYTPITNEKGHSLFMSDIEFSNEKKGEEEKKNRCYEVRIKVVIDDNTYEMSAPLMNGAYVVRNDTINQLRISNAQARAFVKCVAIHTGLGFNLWLDEDTTTDTDKADSEEFHDILTCVQRVKKKYARLAQLYGDSNMLNKKIGLSEKQIKNILDYSAYLDKFEKALSEL